jgi:hypothetical protein
MGSAQHALVDSTKENVCSQLLKTEHIIISLTKASQATCLSGPYCTIEFYTQVAGVLGKYLRVK